MSANDYGMPMSPRPESTAVNGGPASAKPRAVRPRGIVELRDRGGTMVGDLSRTSSGLTVYDAKLKAADSDDMRAFKQPVFVPWQSVLYWSTERKPAINGA